MIALDTVLIRLALAVAFAAAIGIERQWRHKNAGIKTNAMVSIGAAAFAMVSNTFGEGNNNPGQIAAAVVTGIGFIGAGVIIHRGATVQGVTTAATLWANASMGLAVGLGQYYVGGVVVAGVVLVQLVMRRVERWMDSASASAMLSRIELAVQCDPTALPAINELWRHFAEEAKLTTQQRASTRGLDRWTWRVSVTLPQQQRLDLATLEEKLVPIPGVMQVESRFLGLEDEPSAGI